jgi:hypothetical protein
MEYAALFIWLVLCLVLGAAVHYVLAGAMERQAVRLLAAPGTIIRKFAMAQSALFCGATLTNAKLYDLTERDVDFQAEGVSSVAKAVVPLMPLFACAAVMVALNAMFAHPFRLDYSPPSLSSLDTSGLKGFLLGTWELLAQVVRLGMGVDWGNPRLYVLFALTFSLALGAAAPLDRVREAVIGAALLAVGLAVVCGLSERRGFFGGSSPALWALVLRRVVMTGSAAAFVMMVYGLAMALILGMGLRVYEMVVHAAPRARSGGRTEKLPAEKKGRRAA